MATHEDLAYTVSLVEHTGRRIYAARGDVRSYADLSEAVHMGMELFGQIDIVCANAGIASTGLAWKLTEEQWREMIDVNLTGSWLTAKAAIPAMIESGQGGSIIFISSVAGLIGRQHMAHYVAAKHGLVGLMRTLANELAEYRIRVNSIHPTNVNTDMIRNPAAHDLYAPPGVHGTPQQFIEAITDLNAFPIPWVESSDVSNAVLWLASEESRYVTGTVVPVDAGASVKSP